MLIANFTGYIFSPAEMKTHNDKSFFVMKVKVPIQKNNVFIECYLNEGIFKYAKDMEKDSQVFIHGDLLISAYTSKEGQPQPKVHCQVKHIKTLTKPQKKEEKSSDDIPGIDW